MSTAPDLAQPRSLAGRRLGRYEVLSQLASGGMAGVYAARARGVAGFERLVAIKVLHPHLAYEEEFISMFLDEARLAARIRHPNVVPTLDISDTEGDGFFLVMEYIEGDHLGGLLTEAAKAHERLPVKVVVRVVLDALAGLGAAHELRDENGERQNLVHRDISPHNVMVGGDGIARLTDFGVAKAEKRLSSTRAGQFKGKLSYMSPEQASTGFADQRSDLFSMGILLWESLTGRRLFRAENNAATLNKILSEPIPMPSELWADLEPFDEVLGKALAREPEDRFTSAEGFAAALETAARASVGIATPREVGAEVKKRLGEKIAAQKKRIRDAIETLGRADLTEPAIPIPRDGSASIRGPQLAPDVVPTLTGPTSPSEVTRSRLVYVLAGAVVLLLGVLAAVAAVVLGEGDPPPTPRPTATATEPATLEEPEVEPESELAAAEPVGQADDPAARAGLGGEGAEDDEGSEGSEGSEVHDDPEPTRARTTMRRRDDRRRRDARMTEMRETPMVTAMESEPDPPRMDPPRMDPPRMTGPRIVNNPYLQ